MPWNTNVRIFRAGAACLILACCRGKDATGVKIHERVSKMLFSLAESNPRSGFRRLARFAAQESDLLRDTGFLPVFVKFFEVFTDGDEPPRVEVRISVLVLAKHEFGSEWRLTVGDASIRASKIVDMSSEEVQSKAAGVLYFADAVFLLPAAQLSGLDNDGVFVLSVNGDSCQMQIGSNVDVFERERVLALEAGEPAIELHVSLKPDLIAHGSHKE